MCVIGICLGWNGGGGRIVRIRTLLLLLPRRRNDPPPRMPQLLRYRTTHYSNRWWLLTIPPPTTTKGMPTRSNNSNTSNRIRVWWNMWWTIYGLIKKTIICDVRVRVEAVLPPIWAMIVVIVVRAASTVIRRGSSNRHPIFLPGIVSFRFGIVFVHTTAHRLFCILFRIIVDNDLSRHTIPIRCGPYTMK